MPSPEEVVAKQVNAYNSRDVEGFVQLYSPDVEIFDYRPSQSLRCDDPLVRGSAQLRERYKNLFANSPKLKASILNRICLCRYVIDRESVSGRLNESSTVEAIAIYEVENALIRRVWFIKA